MDNLRTLYDILQRDGYDVPQEYEKFWGKLSEDKKSRESLYAVLKNDNYDVPDDYGHFSMILFGAGEKEKAPDAETMPFNGKRHHMKGGFGAGTTGVAFTPDITFGKSKPGLTGGVRYKPTDNPLAFKPKSFSERNLELIPDQLYNSADIEKAVAAVFENEKSKAEKQAEAAQENFNNGAAFIPSLATGITRGAIDAKNTDPENIIGKVYDKLRPRLTGLIESRVHAPSTSGTKPEQAVREQVVKEVRDHIRSLIAGKYIAEKTPVNASEYISGSAAKDNVLSMLGSAIVRKAGGSSGAAERLEDEAYGRYGEKAGMWERIGAGVATLVADAPAFAFTGGLGSAAGRGLVQFAGKPLASNGLTSFAGKVASEAGKRSFTSSLSGRIITGAVDSGVTLGGYDAVSETARQMRYGEYNFGDIAGATGKGAAIGALVAPIGITGRYITRASGKAVKASADVGALGLESAVFAMPGVLDKIAGGGHVGLDEMGEEFGVSIATLGMLKLKNAGRLRKEIRSRYYSAEAGSMKLTGLDKEILDSRGYGVSDLFKTEKLDNTEYHTVTERGVKASKPETASGKVLAETEILAGYENAMRDSGVPLSVKAKLAYLIEGRTVTNVPVVYGSTIEERDGRHFVTSMNAEGRPIETKEYRTKGKASRAFEKLQDISQRNSIEATENICDRYAQKTALYKACQESGDPASLFAEYMGISRKEEKQRTPDEQTLYAGISAKADKYFDRQAISGEIKSRVGNSTGIDIDKAVVTPVKQRSESQQSAVDRYIDELRSKFLRPQKHEDRGVRLDAKLLNGKDVTIVSGEPEFGANGKVSNINDRVYIKDSMGKVTVVEAKDISSVTESPVATIEDFISLNRLSDNSAEFARENSSAYEEQISALNEDLSKSMSYSHGTGEKPETFDYWKEKLNLPDPEEVRETQEIQNKSVEDSSQVELEDFMSSLPRTKDGNMDFENFTHAQLFEYTRQTDGEETAISDAYDRVNEIDGEIKKLEKGILKVTGSKRVALRDKVKILKFQKAEIASLLPEQPQKSIETKELNLPDGSARISIKKTTPFQRRLQAIEEKASSIGDRILFGIASGDYKFRWNDKPGSKGIGSELGLSNSQSERRARIGILSNSGYTPETLAHHIWEETERRFDNADIRNEIIDVLNSISSRRQALEELESKLNVDEDAYYEEQAELAKQEDEELQRFKKLQEEILLKSDVDNIEYLLNLAKKLGLSEEELDSIQSTYDLAERLEQLEEINSERETELYTGRNGTDAEADSAFSRSGEAPEVVKRSVGERNGSAEAEGNRTRYRDSQNDYSNLTPEEKQVVDDANLKIDSEIEDTLSQLKQKKSDLRAAKERIADNYEKDNQTSLFGTKQLSENVAKKEENNWGEILEKEEKILNLAQEKTKNYVNEHQERLQVFDQRKDHGGNDTPVLRGDNTSVHGNGESEPGESDRGDGRLRLRGDEEYVGDRNVANDTGSDNSDIRIVNDSLDSLLDSHEITHTQQRISSVTPEDFQVAISSQHLDNPDGWMVSFHDTDYYKSAKLFLTEDGKSGIAISPDGDIVSLFSNVTGDTRMEKLMLLALINGGKKLDCFDLSKITKGKGLPDLYSRYGFEAVSTVPFNKESAPDGWTENAGELPIIFMVHNGKSVEDVAKDYDRKSRADRTGLKEFEDYDEAMNYRDSVLKSRKQLEPLKTNDTSEVVIAESEINTSPTEAQKEAGNYKMGHVRIDGHDVTIENPKGSERKGIDPNGKQWRIVMNNTYGYIRRTKGVDGDHIDIFLSDNPENGNVYVVDQVNKDGSFDEHKVMYGFNSKDEAKQAYLSNYENGWAGLGSITGVTKETFKEWIKSSKRKIKPFSEYNSVKEKNIFPLTEELYAEKRSKEILDENQHMDEVKAYNKAIDEYPSYIHEKIKRGELEDLYARSPIGDRVKLGDIVKSAGLETYDITEKANKEASIKENKYKKGDVVAIKFYDGTIANGLVEVSNDGKVSVRSFENHRVYNVDESYVIERLDENDIRYPDINEYTREEQEIISTTKANGSYLKAPNGNESNLDERQWLQVRTKAFKNWFGDWEKSARIEKLRQSNPVEITHNNEYELNRKSAKDWLKENIRGEYTNADTGDKIEVSKVGINEVTAHGSQDESHLKSLAGIPHMIEQSIFIDEIPNIKVHDKYDSYRYYVCGLKIDGTDYTAKIVVGVKGDSKYYDHHLSEIEKGTLIENLNGLSNSVALNQNSSVSGIKDKRLLSILQTNHSKVLDSNGEPLVVYHGSRSSGFDIFEENNGIYFTDSTKVAKVYSNGWGVSPWGGMNEGMYNVYLDMRNPIVVDADGKDWDSIGFNLNEDVLNSAEEIVMYMRKHNLPNDGIIVKNVVDGDEGNQIGTNYVVLTPNQIKDSFANKGIFSPSEESILYKQGESVSKTDNKDIETSLTELESEFRVPVDRVNISSITNPTIKERAKRGAKAWYDTNTGKVNIIIDNIINADDATISYIYEVIAHKGLRDMLGAGRHSELMQSVYESMDVPTRIQYNSKYKNPNIAADEYMADVCEEMFNRQNRISGKLRNAWNSIVGIFRNFFRKLFNLKISDADIEYLLWQSSQRLRNNNGSIVYHAQNSVLKHEVETARNYRGNLNEKEIIERDNARFNNELLQQIDDKLPKGYIYKLGYPGDVLKSVGMPDLPIEVPASTLSLKYSSDYKSSRPYDLSDVENLVEAIQYPIAIFDSEELNGKKIILTELKDKKGKNFIAIIGLKSKKGRSVITVNNVISLYPKDSVNHIAKWFDSTNPRGLNMKEDLLLWADTKKASQWLSTHSSHVNVSGLSSRRIANKIKRFESSKPEDNNLMFRGYGDNQENSITGNKDILPANNSDNHYSDNEKLIIQSESIGNDTYLKAPNGNSTLLTPEQWLLVRTKAFKNWFGDWEKLSRIEKLRKSKPIEITGNEIEPSEDLKQYKKNALEYGKNLRGEYVNRDTGEKIFLTGGNKRGGIREILQHDYKNPEHLQSIAAIPDIIEDSIFITELPNDYIGRYQGVKTFRYYVCGLRINDVDYTVKAVVALQNNGNRYYDHSLTQIEKGELLSKNPTIQKAGIDSDSPLYEIKDKRLLSILQTGISKALDVNGEPLSSDVDEFNSYNLLYRNAENKGSTNEKNIESRLTELEREFRVPVERVAISEINNPVIKGRALRGAKAWYDTNTGKVSIITDNIINAGDAAISYIHELIAHKGLRDMLGAERHSELMQRVYESMDPNVRKAYTRKYVNPDMSAGEYIADICEKIYDNRNNTLSGNLGRAWNRIVVILRNFFRKLFKLKINDADIEYMLWQSSQHLRGNKKNIVYQAQNSLLKHEVENARNYRGNLNEKKIIERDNTRFNNELRQQIDGKLPKGYIYKLGYPGENLKSAGIPDLPVELSSSLLSSKSNINYVSNHPFGLPEVKNLVNAIQNPIAVFDSKTHISSKVILTELKHNGTNFVVALQVNTNARGYGRNITINSIRSVYPKDNVQDIIEWINRGDLLRYADKTKVLNWLTQQRSNSADVESPIKNLDVATKIIERFDNPKSDNNNLMFRGYSDNQENNIINNNENKLSVTAGDNGYTGNEKLIIESKSLGNGTYLKAPNGESTLLTPEQWRIVRTKGFKNWFGDWEKPSRIEKLRRSKPIEITGKEIEPSEDLKQYKKNALEYGKNLRGKYINEGTGIEIEVNGNSIKEVLHHDYKNVEHLQSVAAIPGLIEKGIYIISEKNTGEKDIDSFDYYVSGLRIGGVDYTVKYVISNKNDGSRYYDHKLTKIEKEKLLDLSAISSAESASTSPFSDIKDKRLLSILQPDFSKPLDVNGEPLSSDVEEFNSQSSRYLRGNKKSIIYHAQNPVLKHDAETASDYDGTLTEKAIIERYNVRFNEELQQQIDGTLPIGHVYKLGYPSEILKRAGIPDLPVEFSASRLLYTSGQDIHLFDLPKMKDLPLFIQNPLAVFRGVPHAGSFVIAIESKHRGKNFVVAIEANEQKGKLKINYLRGTHYRKSNAHIANWINEGLLEYADKKKMLEWLSKQRYNSAEVRNTFKHATNIINNFENPESDDNNLIFRGYVDNQENNIINNNENKLSVTAGNNGYTGNEKLIIESKLRGDGTYLKAPNGESTLLTPEQWLLVRSKGFKEWFGDWEKQSRIEKLRKSKPIVITGNEYKGKYELNRKSAKKWIKENLRSKYVNRDTGDSIELNRKGADKVTAHGMSNDAHLKSIAVIPELIGESVFLAEVPNEKNNGKYENYRYYVCGLKIGEIHHTVKLTVGEKGGKKYYDHSLTEIEKGKLIDITSPNGFKTKGDKSSLSSTSVKDTKLLSILQTNFSKPLDVNGEPMPEAIAEYNDMVPDILYRIKEVGEGKYIDTHNRNTTAVYKAISAYIKEHPDEFTDYSESSSSGTTSKYIKFRYHDVSYNVRFSNHTKTGNETGAASDSIKGITVILSQEDASITKVKMDLSHIRLTSSQIKEVLSEVVRYNAGEANRFDIAAAKVSVINNYRDGKPYVPYSIDISGYPYIGTAIEKYFRTDMPAITADTAGLVELRRKERRLMKKMHGVYAVGNYEVKVSWRGEIQSVACTGIRQPGTGRKEKAATHKAAREAENYVAGLIAPLKEEYLQVLSSIKSGSAVHAVYAKAVRLPFYRTIDNATPEKYNCETGLSEIFSVLEKLEREFGVPVEHVGIYAISDPVIKKQARRGAKAWYDAATGKVFIITDNIADSGDAMISYVHEVVAHKGLRDMLGAERHSELMHSVYESMDAATRVKYDSRYTNPHIAADEYIADLCEKIYNGSNTYSVKLRRAWNRIVGILRNFFRKLFNLKINDADIEYLLWQSVQHLRNNKGGIIYHAQNSILKHEAETARNYRGNITEKELIEKDNTRFNEELQQQIDGTLSKGHIYKLGYPGDVLKSAGISDLPIEVAASTLSLKSSSDYKSNHPFDLSEIRNLVEAIQYPIAVFESEELNGKKVVLTELKDKRGKDFVAVIGVSGINGRSYIDINKVISLYPKDSVNHIAKWFDSTNKQGLNMNEDLLLWADTKKASQWLSTHSSYVNASGLSSRRITNKIKRFENPKSEDNNLMFRGYGDNRHIPGFCSLCPVL